MAIVSVDNGKRCKGSETTEQNCFYKVKCHPTQPDCIIEVCRLISKDCCDLVKGEC